MHQNKPIRERFPDKYQSETNTHNQEDSINKDICNYQHQSDINNDNEYPNSNDNNQHFIDDKQITSNSVFTHIIGGSNKKVTKNKIHFKNHSFGMNKMELTDSEEEDLYLEDENLKEIEEEEDNSQILSQNHKFSKTQKDELNQVNISNHNNPYHHDIPNDFTNPYETNNKDIVFNNEIAYKNKILNIPIEKDSISLNKEESLKNLHNENEIDFYKKFIGQNSSKGSHKSKNSQLIFRSRS